MGEEASCEDLLEVGDPGEGRCVWEVEVGESHFEGWSARLRFGNCRIVSLTAFFGCGGRVVFSTELVGCGEAESFAPVRFDKWRPSMF